MDNYQAGMVDAKVAHMQAVEFLDSFIGADNVRKTDLLEKLLKAKYNTVVMEFQLKDSTYNLPSIRTYRIGMQEYFNSEGLNVEFFTSVQNS